MVSASIASSKPKVELDSHADKCVDDDIYLVIQCQDVDVTVGYSDPHNVQKYIMIINKVTQLNGLKNNLLCTMQCHLNGVHIGEVPKILADRPSETSHAIQVIDPFDAAHELTIPLQKNSVTSYFNMYSLIIAE